MSCYITQTEMTQGDIDLAAKLKKEYEEKLKDKSFLRMISEEPEDAEMESAYSYTTEVEYKFGRSESHYNNGPNAEDIYQGKLCLRLLGSFKQYLVAMQPLNMG